MLLWLLSAKWIDIDGKINTVKNQLVAGDSVQNVIKNWRLNGVHDEVYQIEEISLIRLGKEEEIIR